MTLEQWFWILLGIFAIALFYGIKATKKTKKENDLDIDEYINSEGEIITTHAEVIDIACGTKMVGSKNPKAVQWFVITFKKDNGEIIEVPVDNEMYEGFDIGMKGELKLVNGQLNSFQLD